MQDLQLAADAQQAGQRNVAFGTGLFGTGTQLLGNYGQGLTGAYAPFTSGLGVGQSIEQLGQNPLDIGSQLGGRTATAGANMGQSLLMGGLSAAKTAQQGNAYNPWGAALTGLGSNAAFTSGLGSWLGGLGGAGSSLGLGNINPVSGEYMGSLEF
jgi:hypothetical protein